MSYTVAYLTPLDSSVAAGSYSVRLSNAFPYDSIDATSATSSGSTSTVSDTFYGFAIAYTTVTSSTSVTTYTPIASSSS